MTDETDTPLLPEPTAAPVVPDPNAPNADGVVTGPPLDPPDSGADGLPQRPPFIAEKFWDSAKGQPRLEQLAKSYVELEKKLGSRTPVAPEKYELKMPEGFEDGLDPADEAFFRDAGLTNEQAQKAVDYLYGTLVPALHKATAEAELGYLAAAWQMPRESPEFGARMKALGEWAYQNLPAPVVKHMSRTAQGVQQLWQLMQAGDMSAARGAVPAPQVATRDQLVAMMNDPRYFAGDEAYIREVERAAGLA